MIVLAIRALFIALMMLWLTALVARANDERNPATVRAFRAAHPCPATGKTTGPCKGWVVDHIYPLCAGGHDAVENMMWQEYRAAFAKDRIERELCRCRKAL